MSQFAELLTECPVVYVKPPRNAVDILRTAVPLSNKINCIYDEAYAVCIADWIYVMDRRAGVLRPVEDWHTLYTVLRGYTNFVVSNVNPRAREVVKHLLETSKMDMSVYYKRTSIEFRGARYDGVLILSDAPCIVYLLSGPSISTHVNIYECRVDDFECHKLAEYVEEALKQFKTMLNK